MYKRAEVEAMARQAVAEHYKVSFVAGAMKAMGTVGKALGAGGGAGGTINALSAGAASRGMGNGVMKSLGHAAQGFHQAGGTKALGQLGAGAATIGGAGYLAGRGFGAGQQAAQPQR